MKDAETIWSKRQRDSPVLQEKPTFSARSVGKVSPQGGAPAGNRCCTAVHYVYKYLSGKPGESLPRSPSETGTLQFNTGRGITRSRMSSRSAEVQKLS